MVTPAGSRYRRDPFLKRSSPARNAPESDMPRMLGSLATTAFAIALSAHGADLAEGIDLYKNHCAACHGAYGEGDGPAAPAMRTPVPSLRVLARRNGDVFPTDAVTAYIDGRDLKAAHGNREMPIWGDVFRGPDQKKAGERIDSLVEFLKTMQEAPRPAPH
jgi:mono/diheme cytochrome c family protein